VGCRKPVRREAPTAAAAPDLFAEAFEAGVSVDDDAPQMTLRSPLVRLRHVRATPLAVQAAKRIQGLL
jgi:hypothetical protein